MESFEEERMACGAGLTKLIGKTNQRVTKLIRVKRPMGEHFSACHTLESKELMMMKRWTTVQKFQILRKELKESQSERVGDCVESEHIWGNLLMS